MANTVLLSFLILCGTAGAQNHQGHHKKEEEEESTFDPAGFKLPVFPSQFEGTIYDSTSEIKLIETDHNGKELNKYIPRTLWFAIRNRNHSHPDHHKGIKERNPGWKINYFDNDAKDAYMKDVWGNTSVYAVYDVLNPVISCSRPEIWRLVTLYHYGGIYMDDDSTIGVPFDSIVKDTDRYIAGQERYDYDPDRCYIDAFRLSKVAMDKRFPNTNPSIKPFENRFFMNWAIATAPRHPLIRRVLETIVEIIQAEYKGKPYVKYVGQDRGKRLMCSTTFPLSYVLWSIHVLLPVSC
jgi:mannosyltransferase OCH1-like enzyme